MSEEACRAHPVFIHSSNAFVVSLVPSEGICISIRCYSVSVEDCEASRVATYKFVVPLEVALQVKGLVELHQLLLKAFIVIVVIGY